MTSGEKMEWIAAIVSVVILFEIFVRTRTKKPKPFRAEDWTGFIVEQGNHSGRPKGLIWTACVPSGEPTYSEDGRHAYAPFEIQFAISPGSAMEGVDVATIPRPVTAIFEWSGNHWRMTRPPVFNLSPRDVMERS